MIFRLFAASSILAAAVTAQCPSVPATGCNICGNDGTCVQAPDAVFVFPNQPDTPCGVLQGAGFDGLIPLDQCPFLPGVVGVCACGVPSVDTQTDAPVPAPTDAPMPAPTDAPASACPDVPASGCNVCAAGTCVQAPDEIFEFAGEPPVPCGLLESSGFAGFIPLSDCAFLPGIINTICGCGTPSAMVPPTAPPVSDTPAPVTPAPVPVPEPPATDPPVPVPATDPPVPVPPATDPPIPAPPATDPPVPVPPATDPPSPAVGPGCPAISPTGCNICPDGTCVQNADAIFMFPDQPTVACGELEAAGIGGTIPIDSCPFLPEITGICECGVPGVAPPTPSPVQGIPTAPTPFPITVFTPRPTPTADAPGSSEGGGGGGAGGMGMSGMGMGKMMMKSSNDGGMSMAGKLRRLGIKLGNEDRHDEKVRGY